MGWNLPISASGTARKTLAIRVLRRIIAPGLLLSSYASIAAPPPDRAPAAMQRPNFLVIVADDLGYSEIGAFGGDIETPNLDRLASRGVRLTDYHVNPSCSPTRAALLTGSDSHVTGFGAMAEAMRPEQRGKPGYECHLNQSVRTIAERLRDAGYFTAMTGKWHLGGGPADIPAARGFDRSFALINGAANYFGHDQGGALSGTLFASAYFENAAHSRLPEGAYTTDYFATRLIDFLDENEQGARKPFFAYLAFNAPHTPLQAPADLIAKYRGRFDMGPAAVRNRRLQRMRHLGIVADRTVPAPMLDTPAWSSLSPAARVASTRRMETYAAAVDRLDQNVGRVLAVLERKGELANTVVIFMSDNGAEGNDDDNWLNLLERLGYPRELSQAMRAANARPETIGSSDSYAAYGPDWAQAGMVPFRLTKSFTFEGGIRAPLIVAGPGIHGGRIVRDFANVTDITPTILAMSGTKDAQSSTGSAVREPDGISILGLLNGERRANPRTVGWELFGRRAIRSGQWKAVYQNRPVIASAAGTGPAHWALYNLARDPGETTDLGQKNPRMLGRMVASWITYAKANGVIDVPQVGEEPAASVPAPRNRPAQANSPSTETAATPR